jgi:hypothetical protein
MSRTPVESHRRIVVEVAQAVTRVQPLLTSHRMDDALCRAHDWALDPTGSSEGPRAVGGHSDPTFAAATNRTADEGHLYRRLLSKLETLVETVGDIIHMEGELQILSRDEAKSRRLDLTGTSANRVIICHSIACDDAAPAGLVHCLPCNTYLMERPGTEQVPKEVIQARIRIRNYRESTRRHVTGPLATEDNPA